MTRSRAYLVRPEAENDLRAIARYTRRQWGREQARKYLRAFHEKFQVLAANPELGVRRDEIAEGYRSARAGRHQIFYRIEGATIVIVRVLPESMDTMRHFDI